MVTETAPAVVETQTQVVDPASTADVQVPSSAAQEPVSTEEQASGGEEGEGASQEQEEPAERTPADLHALITGDIADARADGLLSQDEYSALKSYRQSLADRGQKLQARLSVTSQVADTAANSFLQAFNDPDVMGLPDATRNEILGPKWQSFRQAVGNNVMAEAHVALGEALAEIRGGDALVRRAEASDMTVPQLITALVPEIKDLLEGNLKQENADLKRQLRDSKQARANATQPKVPGNGVTGTPSNSTEMAYSDYLKLTEPEKKQFNAQNPEKFNAFLGIGVK